MAFWGSIVFVCVAVLHFLRTFLLMLCMSLPRWSTTFPNILSVTLVAAKFVNIVFHFFRASYILVPENLVLNTLEIFAGQVDVIGFQNLTYSFSYTSDVWNCNILLHFIRILIFISSYNKVLSTFANQTLRIPNNYEISYCFWLFKFFGMIIWANIECFFFFWGALKVLS